MKAAGEKSENEVSVATKAEILEQIANQSVFASEKLVAKILDITVVKNSHLKPQADDSVLATLSIPKEIFDKIEQAQSLISHSLENKDLVKFLEYAADLIIKQKTSVRKFKSTVSVNLSSKEISADKVENETLANENTSQHNRHVAVKKKHSLSTKLKPFTPRQRKIIL